MREWKQNERLNGFSYRGAGVFICERDGNKRVRLIQQKDENSFG